MRGNSPSKIATATFWGSVARWVRKGREVPPRRRPLLDANVETAKAMSGLLTLADVARRDARFSKLEYDALEPTAHELIGPFVLTLNEWRVKNHDPGKGISVSPPTQSNSFRKVRRNDPCPCGSGKKYKKCCGLN